MKRFAKITIPDNIPDNAYFKLYKIYDDFHTLLINNPDDKITPRKFLSDNKTDIIKNLDILYRYGNDFQSSSINIKEIIQRDVTNLNISDLYELCNLLTKLFNIDTNNDILTMFAYRELIEIQKIIENNQEELNVEALNDIIEFMATICIDKYNNEELLKILNYIINLKDNLALSNKLIIVSQTTEFVNIMQRLYTGAHGGKRKYTKRKVTEPKKKAAATPKPKKKPASKATFTKLY